MDGSVAGTGARGVNGGAVTDPPEGASPVAPVPAEPRRTTLPQGPTLVPAAAKGQPLELPARVGHYTLIRAIDRGALSVVYLARDLLDGRRVALKVYDEKRLHPREFARELRMATQLDHPNIVRVIDGGVADERFFIAMELLEGGSLAGLVANEGPLGPGRAVSMVLPIARALAHAHERGILHRDVKPENILVDLEGRTSLTDFGIAVDLRDGHLGGQCAGTPAFMAPEQLLGLPLDVRTDVYGLGGTLYECLTGVTPFTARTRTDLQQMILSRAPTRPSLLAQGVPAALDAVVLRCLAKRPALRFPSASALARALVDAAAGLPGFVEEGAVRPRSSTTRAARRHA
jgi:eukaryotic-like serine/threonine-protein kinase